MDKLLLQNDAEPPCNSNTGLFQNNFTINEVSYKVSNAESHGFAAKVARQVLNPLWHINQNAAFKALATQAEAARLITNLEQNIKLISRINGCTTGSYKISLDKLIQSDRNQFFRRIVIISSHKPRSSLCSKKCC